MGQTDRRRCLCILVQLLKRLLEKYFLAPVVAIAATSPEPIVMRVYKQVLLAAHPDKGGDAADFRALRTAKENLQSHAKSPGRPRKEASPPQDTDRATKKRPASARQTLADVWKPTSGVMATTADGTGDGCEHCAAAPTGFRLQCVAVMLTYNGAWTLDLWRQFLDFVRRHRTSWNVRWLCATLEKCQARKYHVHLMLQFSKTIDVLSSAFQFCGMKPNARPEDSAAGGRRGSPSPQRSIDRGFFYVYANKIGTARDEGGDLCVSGNYAPVWTSTKMKYAVAGKWAEDLWKQRKLPHEQYGEYLVLCRDGYIARKRALDAVQQAENEAMDAAERQQVTKRIRCNVELFKPFKQFLALQSWLAFFLLDMLRYPILIIMGPSFTGKTELAKSLFRIPLELKIGALMHFPNAMRRFCRRTHDGIVLDDVRDLAFITEHQHIFQGKYDTMVEFGSSPCGGSVYEKYLFKIPFVATVNRSTLNKEFLDSHDWLGKPENRILFELNEVPWDEPCIRSTVSLPFA